MPALHVLPTLALALGMLLSSRHARAAQSSLTATTAEAVVGGCRAHASAKGQSHAIAVFDAGGGLVAALRMDGNRAGVMAFAMAKARASASWGFSTAAMGDAVQQTPGFAAAPDVVTVPGGVPVYSADGTVLLGSVGVSGEAPADDAACAEAGIRAAGLSHERRRAQTDSTVPRDPWEVAERLVESLGGREVWSSAHLLYVRETAYPVGVAGPVRAEFWRNLDVPAYRSIVSGPGLHRETEWTADSGWTVRNGVRTEMNTAELDLEVAGWVQEPYVMYRRLALRDSTLHLTLSDDHRLDIYDGRGGRLLSWFVVDASGALLKWGNIYDGAVNEHVYGPLRPFGALRMPRWGTSTTGARRFEYEEVRIIRRG